MIKFISCYKETFSNIQDQSLTIKLTFLDLPMFEGCWLVDLGQ